MQLGPTFVTGSGLSTASADLNQQGQWEVRPVFKSGAKGIDLFNKGAGQCYSGASTCPTKQMAIVLDNRVLTAPTIDNASFQADQITISGSFSESEVHDIATALKYGALPVPLVPQTSEIVSATLGRDALRAGLIAGAVGFVLVGLYMIAFYRLLGVLAMLKLFIEGCIMWAFLCWAGPHLGLAITLAGLTGIVVSIGVSLDSNVVYYEHLKEDVRSGRTIRASVDKSFVSAWRTIVAADGASVLGAVLLWYLTVGAVRGFAFYLGPVHRARPHHLVVLHAPGGGPGHALQDVRRAPAPIRPARRRRRGRSLEDGAQARDRRGQLSHGRRHPPLPGPERHQLPRLVAPGPGRCRPC